MIDWTDEELGGRIRNLHEVDTATVLLAELSRRSADRTSASNLALAAATADAARVTARMTRVLVIVTAVIGLESIAIAAVPFMPPENRPDISGGFLAFGVLVTGLIGYAAWGLLREFATAK